MQEVLKVQTIVAVPNTFQRKYIPPPYSFAGGQVLSSSQMFAYMDQLGMDPLPIAPFPTSAELMFTFRQIYSRSNSALPLEYFRKSADMLVFTTKQSLLRPARLWMHIGGLVGWKFKDSRRECVDFEHLYNITTFMSACRTPGLFENWKDPVQMNIGMVQGPHGLEVVDKKKWKQIHLQYKHRNRH
jgi:hypothetical protein